MHQFLSTLLSFLLSPLHWILLLLIAGFFWRKSSIRKICSIAALVIFLIFSNPALLNWYAGKFQPAPVLMATNTVYSCGIVPGGFASPDADGNGVFNSTAERFVQVVKLFKLGHISHILVSGGNGKAEMNAFREGAWVKKQLIIMGVPDSVIFVEDQSNNTAENAVNSKKILLSNRLSPPYLLISSAHHLPRATLLFKKAGVSTVAFPCNYIAGRGIPSLRDMVPNIGTLFTWELYLKETAGFYWYR